ncbi:MAG: ABC transporter permease [Melioribacteraceae bacterium]|nr:ABC transporter permease [Melioribacteraceae bacterium]
MNDYFKIAWRNIWRNKRRTILTMMSIFLAAFLSLFTRSMQKGSYANMIDNAVKLSTGYLQIHDEGFWENKSIDRTFIHSKELLAIVENSENVTIVLPRLESFALVSSGLNTKGSLVIATEPEIENGINKLAEKMISGEYLIENDQGIIVAEKLAEYLQIETGDTLVLLGQGYHGVTAAAQYRVKGIFKFPIPQLNNQLIYMSLQAGQEFYAAYNRATSYSIMIDNPETIDELAESLSNEIGDQYEVMTWDKMNKEMVQAIQSDNVGGVIMLGILYLVIGFGVFGTVMMMTMERRKEFAVMVAVGMQKIKLFLIVFTETLMIGLVAVLAALIASYPLLLYLYYNPIPLTGEIAEAMEMFGVEPIMPFAITADIFINQSLAVILISIIAILYPLSSILRFNILKAMRS